MASKSEFMFDSEVYVSYEEKKLTLAYENLTCVPSNITDKYGNWLEILDLSHNKIKDPAFLKHFPKLTTIILDHNELTTDSIFPHLFGVHTLWINNNQIAELRPFMVGLCRSFPNIEYLSMMKNPATPCSFGNQTYSHYCMYRYFVISCFNRLNRLDDKKISYQERRDAITEYQNYEILSTILPVTPKYPDDRANKIV